MRICCPFSLRTCTLDRRKAVGVTPHSRIGGNAPFAAPEIAANDGK
jgi:hypothetical protein